MLRRVCTLKGKVGGANRKLCEQMEVNSWTTSRSVEDTSQMTRETTHANHTRITRESPANPVKAHL
eukprot:4585060-Prymnesium_polylepis.1